MDIIYKYEPIYSHISKYGEEISNEELEIKFMRML